MAGEPYAQMKARNQVFQKNPVSFSKPIKKAALIAPPFGFSKALKGRVGDRS
jgi:hypothetical protein